MTFVGLFAMPLYLKFMGVEAYGLVGFFSVLQAIFNLLDLGLSPTVARETARLRGGGAAVDTYLKLLRALQIIFLLVALTGGSVLFCYSEYIATSWLHIQALNINEVEKCIRLMAVCVASRWLSGLYRGCVTGFEEFVWLSYWNMLIAALRFLGVLPMLVWLDSSPEAFFMYQLVIAFVELAGLYLKTLNLRPKSLQEGSIGWSPFDLASAVAPVLKFSIGIAFTSAIWVLVTQTDKLILSKFLSLSDYGYFSLGVLVASGVLMLSSPITNSVIPKIAKLHAENQSAEIILLYRSVTQWVSIVIVPACTSIALFSGVLLFVWTGNQEAASNSSLVLKFYAIGNGLMALGSLPLLLQYGAGKIRLHVVGNLIYGCVFFPMLVWTTSKYGINGSCWSWLFINSLSFFFWVPVVHRTFMPRGHLIWLFSDILRIAFPVFIIGFLVWICVPPLIGRLENLLFLVVVSVSLLITAMASSSVAGPRIRRKIKTSFGTYLK